MHLLPLTLLACRTTAAPVAQSQPAGQASPPTVAPPTPPTSGTPNPTPASSSSLTLAWSWQSDQADALAGSALATGDFDLDGFDDLAVGVPFEGPIEPRDGAVHIFRGSAAGLPTEPDLTIAGAGELGASLALGDVDGDGYPDLAAGSPLAETPEPLRGAFEVYFGGPGGLDLARAEVRPGTGGGDGFATTVAVTDLDGDGLADVIAGDPGYTDAFYTEYAEGGLWMWRGVAGGLETEPSWDYQTDRPDGGIGGALSAAGDTNGDGYGDLLSGAYGDSLGIVGREGTATLFLGGVGGPGAVPAWLVGGGSPAGFFGQAVTAAGDVDGDGFDDIAIGAPEDDAHHGGVFLFRGNAAALETTWAWTADPIEGWATGWALAAGDLDRDATVDLLVGAPLTGSGTLHEGLVHRFTSDGTSFSANPAWTGDANLTEAGLGHALTVGDVNGDGFGDVGAGLWQLSSPESREGGVMFWYGGP
jgi:hypothetical protein